MRLFLNSHDRIIETIFRQSRTVLMFGFAPGTDVFGFCGVFLIGPDPDTPPGFPGWSRLVEFHCTIPRECTKGPHLKGM